MGAPLSGTGLLLQWEQLGSRSGSESVLTLLSGGAQRTLVIWEAAHGLQAVHGLSSECEDSTRALQAPCTCRVLEGDTSDPLPSRSGGSPPAGLCPSNLSVSVANRGHPR